MSLRVLQIAALVGAAATLGIQPALAQSAPTTSTTGDCSSIEFQLANPDPGARVEVGDNVLEGIAIDTRAPSGSSGFDRVDFYLGNRDQGGTIIGSALLGSGPAPFGAGSFQATVTFPNLIGGHDLFAYAHDSVTGQESVISEQIAVGEDPSKAFITPPANTVNEMCAAASGAVSPTTAAPASPAPAPSTPVPAVAPATSMTNFEVGNPSAGDTIKVGGYVLQGAAATDVDRIEVFLDNRDQGGTLLGQASFAQNNMWTATLQIPSNMTGLHTLWFYARSSATGQETTLSVPVTIAP